MVNHIISPPVKTSFWNIEEITNQEKTDHILNHQHNQYHEELSFGAPLAEAAQILPGRTARVYLDTYILANCYGN